MSDESGKNSQHQGEYCYPDGHNSTTLQRRQLRGGASIYDCHHLEGGEKCRRLGRKCQNPLVKTIEVRKTG